MPPDSSKKRSNTTRSWVGSPPSAIAADARYSTSCSAADSDRPIDTSQTTADAPLGSPCR